MPTPSVRSDEPDEASDVPVDYTQSRHAGEKRDTWMVFLGLEQHTECATRQAATEVARTLAKKHRRRAWLHDATGYPLQPIAL